jgi:biotin carboxyl carrier protein
VTARDRIDLLVEPRGAVIALLSPDVGLFTEARSGGEVLAPGAGAGVLLVLGRALTLVVPEGVEGRVANAPPERTRQPVGWGDVLYEIRPIEDAGVDARHRGTVPAPVGEHGRAAESGRFVVLSPQSGRFYLRPSPGEAPFVSIGGVVEEGQPIGLIEVMKTFAHVRYGGAGLPPRARVSRVLIEDGAEVATGEPLLEVASDLPEDSGS